MAREGTYVSMFHIPICLKEENHITHYEGVHVIIFTNTICSLFYDNSIKSIFISIILYLLYRGSFCDCDSTTFSLKVREKNFEKCKNQMDT